MRFSVLSLFPEYFRGPLDESMIKRAREKGLIDIELVNIRDYALDKHKKTDDRPYGGGPGMVLMPEPTCRAIRAAKSPKSKVIYLSPQGEPLKAKMCRELAKEEHLILLCGHYEGVDERVIAKEVDVEISIGDYVLTNGCLAACIVIDAVSRFVPGVIGDERAASEDSFEEDVEGSIYLDYPHYTRPEEFEGMKVPEVLLSGNHAEIRKWRLERAKVRTRQLRPDLLQS